MLVAGTCVGITTRQAGAPGNEFTETKIHVLDETGLIPRTVEAVAVRDFAGTMPGRGELVVLDVFARAFKLRDGGIGQALTATGRNSDMESALSGVLASA